VQWLIDFIFPAQRHLRRSTEHGPHERLRRLGLLVPPAVPPGPSDTGFSWAEPGSEGWRTMRAERLAARDRVLADQEELLRRAADTLDRTRTTEIRRPAGTISARIVAFRWGPDVLEITRTGVRGGSGFGSCLVSRHAGPARTGELTSRLAYHLAVLEGLKTPPPAG
jgi:hypothetical protein